jgi:hypothetical protein
VCPSPWPFVAKILLAWGLICSGLIFPGAYYFGWWLMLVAVPLAVVGTAWDCWRVVWLWSVCQQIKE